ncbi:MAG: tetratricopeptide repeat protein [Thermoplasmata archaeon]|nr:tetratricopeptide repeat protein [Thermoplasmata archaeon]
MGERALTVRDRIIVHLAGYSRHAEDFECPAEMCQSGISTAMGKSRAHVTLELNRMRDIGLVTERVAHVKGARSKRKTYTLTPQGMTRSSEVNRFLDSMNINIIEPDGTRNIRGDEAVELLRNTMSIPRVMAVDRVLACDGTLEVARKKHEIAKSEVKHIPQKPDFFVPRPEIKKLVSMLDAEKPNTIILLGIPGIGKTTTLAELARSLNPGTNVMYRRIYPYDSQHSVLSSLGEFLNDIGHPSLQKSLANTVEIDLPELGTHIANCLCKSRMALIFDEYDLAPASLDPFFALLVQLVNGSGSSLLIATSRKPEFYTLKDLELEKSIREIKLGPLDKAHSAELFDHFQNNAQYNSEMVSGHPLALKLLAGGTSLSSLAGFVEDEILDKDSELARACRFASVLRKPFNADDIELLGLSSAGSIRRSLAFEQQADGRYTLHPAIGSILNGTMNSRIQQGIHGDAANFYTGLNEDWQEILHHLVRAEKIMLARDLVLGKGEELLVTQNIDELGGLLKIILDSDTDSVKIMEMTARAFDQAGKWDKAMDLAKSVIDNFPETEEAAKAQILLANILAKTGQLADAHDALELFPVTQNKKLQAEVYYARASILRKLGRNSDALNASEKAISLALKGGDKILHARCLMESAMLMPSKTKHEDALERLDTAMKVFVKAASIPDRIRCGINTGIILSSSGNDELAADYFEKAIGFAADAGMNRMRAHGLVNLTDLLNRREEYEKSAMLADEAGEIFSGLGEPMMSVAAMLNHGTALAGLGKDDEAAKVMEDAVSLLKENNLLESRASWLDECAKIIRKMGKHEKVLKALKVA